MAEVGTVYVQVMPTTKGFTKALSSEGGKGGSLAGRAFNMSFGKLIGGSAIGNMIANVVGTVASTISSSMDTAIARVDTIANYPKVMKNLGYGSDEANASIKALGDGIDGLPTSLDGIVSMTQQLAPMCNGLDSATKLSLALNNMFLASGAPLADQERAMRQYSQILSRGKVELQDWRTLQEVMPGQLNQVSQALLGAGKNSTDLYDALKSGKVSLTDFNNAILKLNEEGVDGFASFEQQARDATEGIGTAMDNLRNRTAKAIAKIIDHIGQGNISGVINNMTSKFTYLADVVIAVMDSIVSKIDFAGFERAFGNVVACFEQVFGQGDSAVSFGEGIGNMVNMLIPVIDALTPAIWAVANVLKFCIDNAGVLIPIVLTLAIAWNVLKFAMNFGTTAETLTKRLTAVKPAVAANVPQMLALAVAAIGVGAGIALACVGMLALANAAVQLAAAGPASVVVLALLVGAIAGLAVGAAALGPALTAGAVGFIAFGAAVLMVSVGMAVVALSFSVLAMQLPLIAAYGLQAAVAIMAISGSMALFAVSCAAAGASMMVAAAGFVAFGAGAVVASAGLTAFGVAIGIAAIALAAGSIAMTALATAVGLLSAGLVASAAAVIGMGAAMPMIAAAAPGAAAGLGELAVASAASAIGIGACAPSLVALAASAVTAAAGIIALDAGMIVAAAAAIALSAGLLLTSAAMPTIGSAAPVAASGLDALAASCVASTAGIAACSPAVLALAAASAAAAAGVAVLGASLAAAFAAAFMLSAGIAAASASVSGASATFSSGCSSMATGFDQIRSRAESAMRSATSAVQSAASAINSTRMQANVEFRLGKMPHFSMDGKFDAQTGSVPRISVKWFGGGGIFRKPSVIGVGEAGTEVVENVDRLDSRIQRAVRAAMGNSGKDVNQNFNIYANDPELVASVVSARSRRGR